MPYYRVTPDPVVLARAFSGLRRDLQGVLTIGVTGTKGKTSTTEFIGQLMAARGLRTAILTGESGRIATRLLPPCDYLPDFRAFVRRCRQARVQCFVMELCSWTLAWNAHRGLDLDAAVLTNIGTDHICDHGNLRNYMAVKRRMFRDLRVRPASPRPVAIVNADDLRGRGFGRDLAPGVRALTYARGRTARTTSRGRVWASRIVQAATGTSFRVHGLAARPLACHTRLHGDFNVSNVLAALACAVALGETPRRAVAHAVRLTPPAGRFTIVEAGRRGRPAVVVDYAHTPESLEAALSAAHARWPSGRVHAVFGCGGDCYKGKRPLMGAVAARLADSIVLTSDNARSESPRAIAQAILRGIPPAARPRVRVELDRARAIQAAVGEASGADVVMLLGKGVERVQVIGRRRRPFSDVDVARRALAARRRRGL